MAQQDLLRVEYTGEVSPGNELLVIDDNHVVVETDEAEPQKPPVVGLNAIARIAVTEYIVDGHRERGFRGVWHDLRRPGTEVRVRLMGSSGVGNALRVTADPEEQDADAKNQLVRTRSGHRYFLATPEEKEAA